MFKDEADFKKIVGRLNIDTEPDPAHRESLRLKMLSVYNETGQTQTKQTTIQKPRRNIMTSPIAKLAAAAVIIIGLAFGAQQLFKTRPPQPIPPKPADNGEQDTSYTFTGTPELVPLDIKLPRPMFVGTPQDTRVPNLEKPTGKSRPPFLVPVGTTNVAIEKPVSSSDEEPIIGEIEMLTDGDKEATDGSYVELGPSAQHITIDLEAEHNIYAIVVWHYHKQAWVYFDVVVQVADDADFITNVKALFNNDIDNSSGLGVGKNMYYSETYEGKLIDAKGVRARYVRLYSNGNTANDLNHYIEVEVYGKPVE